MKKITLLAMTLMGIMGATHATDERDLSPWKVGVDFGMSFYSNTMNIDGRIATGRFNLGRTLFYIPFGQVGLELGIQSGNTMRLNFSKESVEALGGVPIEVQVKPILDLLVDFQTKPINNTPLNLWIKGGTAYRTAQLDRESVNDSSRFSPELQVGMGYFINERTSLNLGYQAIWGKKPQLVINPQTETGVFRYIPMQQAVFLGLSYHFM